MGPELGEIPVSDLLRVFEGKESKRLMLPRNAHPGSRPSQQLIHRSTRVTSKSWLKEMHNVNTFDICASMYLRRR